MFAPFSHGYYLGRLYVEPHAGDRAVMQHSQQALLRDRLYADAEADVDPDAPPVVKLGTAHFAVHPSEDVPGDTIGLPESALEEAGVRNPPSLREVLLAKADRASQLLSIAR